MGGFEGGRGGTTGSVRVQGQEGSAVSYSIDDGGEERRSSIDRCSSTTPPHPHTPHHPPPSRCVSFAHDETLPLGFFLRLLRGRALPPVRQRPNEAELRWTFGDWFFFVVVREVEECQESPQRMQGLSGQTLSLSLSLSHLFSLPQTK